MRAFRSTLQNAAMTPGSIFGRVVSGQGRGAAFTGLVWARCQFLDRLGIDPHPGTLNLKITDPQALARWRNLDCGRAEAIDPPGPDFCAARGYPVRLAGEISAAVIVPEVSDYPPDQVELIAALPLRERLRLSDGDSLEVEFVSFSRLRAVIFDVDGTLVDSIGAYYIAASRASAEHGFAVPGDAIRVALNGGAPFWHLVVPEAQRSPELIATLRERTMWHWPAVLEEHVTVFPGIDTTIGILVDAGLKLAIYTGSHGESLPPLVKAGLMHHFDPVLTSAHVKQRKPHPEGLIRCLEALGVEPGEAAYVGDSVQDIQAARAAGMTAIGVLSGTADSALLGGAGPHRVLRDHSALPGALQLPMSPHRT